MDTILIYIIPGILLLIVLVLLRIVAKHWLKNRRQLKKMKVGKKMELKAKKIISRAGFKHIRYQENFFYKVQLDNDDMKICCIPDFVAEKKGKLCVIEVKWGISAPLLSNAATRRQLLEYQHAIQPDKLFLLDMTTRRIKEVRF